MIFYHTNRSARRVPWVSVATGLHHRIGGVLQATTAVGRLIDPHPLSPAPTLEEGVAQSDGGAGWSVAQ